MFVISGYRNVQRDQVPRCSWLYVQLGPDISSHPLRQGQSPSPITHITRWLAAFNHATRFCIDRRRVILYSHIDRPTIFTPSDETSQCGALADAFDRPTQHFAQNRTDVVAKSVHRAIVRDGGLHLDQSVPSRSQLV